MADDADAPDRELTDPEQVPRADVREAEVGADETAEPTAVDESTVSDGNGAPATGDINRRRGIRTAVAVGLVAVAAMAGLVGWLAFRTHGSHRAIQQHQQFLAAARQGALDLTTIDYTRVDADVQRIVDASTTTFGDDFKSRAPAFVQAITQSQAKTQGSIIDAALESKDATHAQVLVAVSVKTATAAAPQQDPRSWRMRVGVEQVGDAVKVSTVSFVP